MTETEKGILVRVLQTVKSFVLTLQAFKLESSTRQGKELINNSRNNSHSKLFKYYKNILNVANKNKALSSMFFFKLGSFRQFLPWILESVINGS